MTRSATPQMCLAWIIVCLGAAGATAQDADAAPEGAESLPVAAVVNGEPLYVGEIAASYASVADKRQFDPTQINQAKAELLDQMINRRLVVQALERDGYFDAEQLKEQVAAARAQIKKEHGVSLEEYAHARGMTTESLRKELIWRQGWNRYLDRFLADALEVHFEKHRKDLDGTEVRASHILLRPERYNETREQIDARANKIREEITSGKMTFAEAAKKYSLGPSRDRGGDLGFFGRRGVMLEDFAKAAFALEKGEISEPVTSAFGTHLITVTDIKPGTKQWTEAIPQIKAVASTDLFNRLAEKERETAKIEFTGKTPYIDPETEQVVAAAVEQAAAK